MPIISTLAERALGLFSVIIKLLANKTLGYTLVPGGSSYYTTTVGSLSEGFVLLAGYSYSENKYVRQSSYSTDGINWIETTMNPSSKEWNDVAYGNGKFVAIAQYSANAGYSTDGINWNQTTLPSDAAWSSIVYGNNKFVAAGSNGIAYSTDGINWITTSISTPQNYLTYYNGLFVCIQRNSNVSLYSTDGISWTATTMPSNSDWVSITSGGGKFVAMANGGISAYSTDGISWALSTNLGTSLNWPNVKYGNGKFVVLFDSTTISFYSTDGINWTQSSIPVTGYWYMAYGNNKFVAIAGSSNKLIYSTDGISWTNLTLSYTAGWKAIVSGQISTLKQVQTSIGGQGTQGAEILAPIDVYTVPTGKTAKINKVSVYNSSANTISYDLGVLDSGVSLTDQNALINDSLISAENTAVVTSITNKMTAGQRIVVLPSSVDVVNVKVYGTES